MAGRSQGDVQEDYGNVNALHNACRRGEFPLAVCSLTPAILAALLITLLAGPAFICFSSLYVLLHPNLKGVSLEAPAG
jgi:hypothetical protein